MKQPALLVRPGAWYYMGEGRIRGVRSAIARMVMQLWFPYAVVLLQGPHLRDEAVGE